MEAVALSSAEAESTAAGGERRPVCLVEHWSVHGAVRRCPRWRRRRRQRNLACCLKSPSAGSRGGLVMSSNRHLSDGQRLLSWRTHPQGRSTTGDWLRCEAELPRRSVHDAAMVCWSHRRCHTTVVILTRMMAGHGSWCGKCVTRPVVGFASCLPNPGRGCAFLAACRAPESSSAFSSSAQVEGSFMPLCGRCDGQGRRSGKCRWTGVEARHRCTCATG